MSAPTADGDRLVSDPDLSHRPSVAAGEGQAAIEALDRLACTLEATQRALDVFVDDIREHDRT